MWMILMMEIEIFSFPYFLTFSAIAEENVPVLQSQWQEFKLGKSYSSTVALTLQQHVGSLVCILLWIKFRGALYALILSMILHNLFVDKIRAMKKCTHTLKA